MMAVEVLVLGGVLHAFGRFVLARREDREAQRVRGARDVDIAEARDRSLVQLHGTVAAVSESALAAPLTGRPVVWARTTVHVRDGIGEWEELDRESLGGTCLVRDEAGDAALVPVDGAGLRATRTDVVTWPVGAELEPRLRAYLARRLAGTLDRLMREERYGRRRDELRVVEEYLAPGEEVWVLGRVRARFPRSFRPGTPYRTAEEFEPCLELGADGLRPLYVAFENVKRTFTRATPQ